MKQLTKLPRGEGSFAYRPNGTLELKKTIHVENGSVRATVYGKTEQECMEKMRKKELEIREQSYFSSPRLLGEAIENWLVKYKKQELKSQSYDRLVGTLRQIKSSDIGHRYYRDLSSDQLQDYIQHLVEKEYAWSTIKKCYDMLNAFYRHISIKDKFHNPMELVLMPRRTNIKVEQKEIEWFEKEDIDKFVEACGTKYNSGRIKYKYGYILAANIYLGLRGGELLALQWKDIDLDKNTIYICKTLIEVRNSDGTTSFEVQESTKRDNNRYVPINSKAKDMILKYKEIAEFIEPEDFVISTSNRKTNTLKNLSDMIRNIEEEGGTTVRAHNTHILRHTCASLYFRAGVPIETICAILGNTREVCEKTYVHFAEEQLKNAASRIVPIIEL